MVSGAKINFKIDGCEIRITKISMQYMSVGMISPEFLKTQKLLLRPR
jgi:hypothetical protein